MFHVHNLLYSPEYPLMISHLLFVTPLQKGAAPLLKLAKV